MTEQYLGGELSLRLARLQAVATVPAVASDLAQVRVRAETCPPAALGSVVLWALALADRLCWASLARGDLDAFARQADASADLFRFGVCASLLDEE